MAINFTKESVNSGFQSTETAEANLSTLETLLSRALSRFADTPNNMESVLDMDSNRIINVPAAVAAGQPVTYEQWTAQATDVLREFTGFTIEEQTATDGQTLFNLSTAYTPGLNALQIHINGVNQSSSSYTETSSTSITFSAGLDAGDVVTFQIASFTVADAVDHDSMAGFVANEHIDHSEVDIIAGVALTGGGDLTADRTLNLDITELTEETTLDATNDDLLFYDASAAAHRTVPIETVRGIDLGDGKWYRNSSTSLSAGTETDVIFNTAAYDFLERGTFSTSTGKYTRGEDTGRVLVTAHATVPALDAGGIFELMIEAPGTTEIARSTMRNDADSNPAEVSLEASTTVNLQEDEVITVRAETSTGETLSAGIASTYITIVELS